MATLPVAFFFTLAVSSAAPINDIGSQNDGKSNSTLPDHSPPFVSEPKGRGTVRLVLSCVITLILCVWTAIHINIIPNPTFARVLKYKALYVFMGLFAPEILLAVAFVEWMSARQMLEAARLVESCTFATTAAKEAERVTADIFDRLRAGDVQVAQAIGEAHDAARVAGEASIAAYLAAQGVRKAAGEVHDARKAIAALRTEERVKKDLARVEKRQSELAWEAEHVRQVRETRLDELEKQDRLDEQERQHEQARMEYNAYYYTVDEEQRETQARLNDEDMNGSPAEQARLAEYSMFEEQHRLDEQAREEEQGRLLVQHHRLMREQKIIRRQYNLSEQASLNADRKRHSAVAQAMQTKSAIKAAARALRKAERGLDSQEVLEKRGWVATQFHRLSRVYRSWRRGNSGRYDKERDFGMDGAFFIIMGGYTFSPQITYPTTDPLTLSLNGLLFLLEAEVITAGDLARLKGDVADKGKADTLAKCLVCAQALWMIVNCFCRKVDGLPVTLIELNVVMHVMCVVVLYSFWWRKPHDVGLPISLSPILLDGGCSALIYTIGKYRGGLRSSRTLPGPAITTMGAPIYIDYGNLDFQGYPPNNSELPVFGALPKPWTRELERAVGAAKKSDGVVMLFRGQVLVDETNGWKFTQEDETPIHVTEQDLKIFSAAAQELREPRFPHLKCIDDTRYTPYELYTLSREIFKPIDMMLSPREIANLFSRRPGGIHISPVVASALCLVYGGAHASVWNSHFPTTVERTLWRVSCTIVATPGILIAAPGAVIALCGTAIILFLWAIVSILKMGRIIYKSRVGQQRLGIWSVVALAFSTIAIPRKHIRKLFSESVLLRSAWIAWIAGLTAALCFLIVYSSRHPMSIRSTQGVFTIFAAAVPAAGLLVFFALVWSCPKVVWILIVGGYGAARVYVVVESFLSVRSLPYGAFESVGWENFWPHL